MKPFHQTSATATGGRSENVTLDDGPYSNTTGGTIDVRMNILTQGN